MSNKVIAITGGNSGIGLAIAELCLTKGMGVAIMGRSASRLAALQAKYSSQLMLFDGDVNSLPDIEQFYALSHAKFKRLDAVVASAGIAHAQPIKEVTEQSFNATFNTNVKGVFFTAQKAIPYLKSGGAMVFVSSIQAKKGADAWAAYGASKAAVRSLARSFASALGDQNIRVNSLSPGVTQTPIFDTFGFEKETLDHILESVTQSTPLKRIGKAQEIAQAAYFLIADESSFMTGSDLQIDGGLTQV